MAGMEAPLLAAAPPGKEEQQRPVLVEVKKQAYLAGPLVAGFLLQNLVQIVSVMFVGHLGELPLASASLATSFAGVTGFSLLTGMACSLDTLCGQAFGAEQHRMLGVYKQRAMLVLAVVSVPVAAVWGYTGEILVWCGQDPEIAAGAGRYIRWMIPALFLFGPLQCHVRFLQTQNLVVPVMLTSGAAALCHPAVCWLLVFRLGLGSDGAALANAVSYLANVSFLAIYVRVSPSCRATWTGFSGEAFRGVRDFLKLTVPSAVMVCEHEVVVVRVPGAALWSPPQSQARDGRTVNQLEHQQLRVHGAPGARWRHKHACVERARCRAAGSGPAGDPGGGAHGGGGGRAGRARDGAGASPLGVRVQQRGRSGQVYRQDDAHPCRVPRLRRPAVSALM